MVNTAIGIHFTYRHVDVPWGGANNFIRALRRELLSAGSFTLTDDIHQEYDVLFMNQLGTGPGGHGQTLSLKQVRALMAAPQSGLRKRQLVVRAVNLNRHAFPMGPRNLTIGRWRDRQTIALLNMADVAIFQSAYQRDFFMQAGYLGVNSTVIHNGAPPAFWNDVPVNTPLRSTVRLMSSTASPRQSKRHDLIAMLSLEDDVEVIHFGAWPKGINSGKVKLQGIQPHEKLREAMTCCHYFLHPAVKDPCPNSVFEAVCAGLPVIYNPGPGSSAEILGSCGLPLNEANLGATLAAARRVLDDLRSQVLVERERFSIGYAASRYRQVFERVAKTT